MGEICLGFPIPAAGTFEFVVMSVDALYGSTLDAWDALGMKIVQRNLSCARGLPAGVLAHYVGRCVRMHLEAEETLADVWLEAIELTTAWLAGRRDLAVSLADQGVIDRGTAARLAMLTREEIDELLDGGVCDA